MRVRTVCHGMLVLLVLRCSLGQTPSELVIVHVNVVDVRAGSVESDATVVISGSKIKAVLSANPATAATGARIVNAHGSYLIPGFWKCMSIQKATETCSA